MAKESCLAVAVAQMPETSHLGRNLREIARFIEMAARHRADVLVFPECALTGYGPAYHESPSAFDPDAVEAAIEEARQLARQARLALVLGAHLPLEGGWSNSALLVRTDGRIAARYDKTHLYGEDVEFYRAGRTAPPVAAVRRQGGKMGMEICFDLRFPEVSLSLALRGAQVIAVPSHIHGKKEMWKGPVIKAHVRSRAAENGRFVVFANAAGPEQNVPSLIADPRGEIRARARRGARELLVAGLDLREVQDDFLRSRRTDLFRMEEAP